MAVATDAVRGLDIERGAITVASLARDRATSQPSQVAMRDKEFGIWQDYTWSRLWELVFDAAHGLLALDVEVGDRVSIHAEDRPEWVILDLAAVAVRGISVGLYPTNPLAEVSYTLADSGANIHMAEDQEQVDKVLAVDQADLPDLRHIVYVEPRGVRSYDDPRLLAWDDLLARGRAHREAFPDAVARRMAEAEPTDVMTLVYTSGTTGPPKGAMLTNANAAFCIDKIVEAKGRFSRDRPPGPRRHDPHLPPVVPHRRAHLLDMAHGEPRHGPELLRVHRDGHREPARGPADAVLRRSPHLGEAARRPYSSRAATPRGSSGPCSASA